MALDQIFNKDGQLILNVEQERQDQAQEEQEEKERCQEESEEDEPSDDDDKSRDQQDNDEEKEKEKEKESDNNKAPVETGYEPGFKPEADWCDITSVSLSQAHTALTLLSHDLALCQGWLSSLKISGKGKYQAVTTRPGGWAKTMTKESRFGGRLGLRELEGALKQWIHKLVGVYSEYSGVNNPPITLITVIALVTLYNSPDNPE